MPQILFPEWRDEQRDIRYPFSDSASLSNGETSFPPDMFIDAILYPIGSSSRIYLSKIVVGHNEAVLHLGDTSSDSIATARCNLIQVPEKLKFQDAYGRPAGMVVSDSIRLSVIRSFGVGEYLFDISDTEFAIDVCVPTPEPGVRGIRLKDGSLFTDKVWIFGGPGITLRHSQVGTQGFSCHANLAPKLLEEIEVNVVGDPLFLRQSCYDQESFKSRTFIRTVTFIDENQSVVVSPDGYGDVSVTVNNYDTTSPAMRVRGEGQSLYFNLTGESSSNK